MFSVKDVNGEAFREQLNKETTVDRQVLHIQFRNGSQLEVPIPIEKLELFWEMYENHSRDNQPFFFNDYSNGRFFIRPEDIIYIY